MRELMSRLAEEVGAESLEVDEGFILTKGDSETVYLKGGLRNIPPSMVRDMVRLDFR